MNGMWLLPSILFFFAFLLGCWLLIPSMDFMFLCADYISNTPKTKHERKKKLTNNNNRGQTQKPYRHRTASSIHAEHSNLTEKYDFDDVDADDDTMCDGNRETILCASHPISEARRALPLLLRVHYSFDFNGIYARIRNLFNFNVLPSMRWIRIRCTGARGQHKRRDDVEKRCEKGLVWALPCVLIDCIIVEKIERMRQWWPVETKATERNELCSRVEHRTRATKAIVTKVVITYWNSFLMDYQFRSEFFIFVVLHHCDSCFRATLHIDLKINLCRW